MSTPAEALFAALASWNAGDLDGYLDTLRRAHPTARLLPRADVQDRCPRVYQGIFGAFDTPQLEFDEVVWDGDACAIRFTMTGRHIAEFMGVPATNVPIALPGITILHFERERVVERFSQADMLGLLVQIGAIPAPA